MPNGISVKSILSSDCLRINNVRLSSSIFTRLNVGKKNHCPTVILQPVNIEMLKELNLISILFITSANKIVGF